MAKKFQRTEMDFTVTSIQWLIDIEQVHADAGFEKLSRELIDRRFFQLVKFLQENGMTNRILFREIDEINEKSALYNSDLNDEGFYFLQLFFSRWSDRIYKDKGEEKEWKYFEKWYVKFKNEQDKNSSLQQTH